MLTPSEYVDLYLKIPLFVEGEWSNAQVRYYLQAGLDDKSNLAVIEKGKLLSAMGAKGLSATSAGITNASISRVYDGKGAPREFQAVLTLVLQSGALNGRTLASYVDTYLGVDCGGFVANYWGVGLPEGATEVYGQTGIKPRTFWGKDPSKQRRSATSVSQGDAVIFMVNVKDGNPVTPAQKKGDGSWDTTTGSQAHHIGLVQAFSVAGNKATITIADSSGTLVSGWPSGVTVTTKSNLPCNTDKTGRFYCELTSRESLYFVQPYKEIEPYGLQYYRQIPNDPRPSGSATFTNLR